MLADAAGEHQRVQPVHRGGHGGDAVELRALGDARGRAVKPSSETGGGLKGSTQHPPKRSQITVSARASTSCHGFPAVPYAMPRR